MRVFARHLPHNEESVVASLLGMYARLPEHHRIRQIFTKCIGAFGKWLNGHPQYLGESYIYMCVCVYVNVFVCVRVQGGEDT